MEKNYKSSRREKLARYSAFAGAVATAAGAQAQIIYTDVNPDATFSTGNQYSLDINNDATPDFVISAETISGSTSGVSYTGIGVVISTAGNNAVVGGPGTLLPADYASALNLYTMIDNTSAYVQASSSSGIPIVMAGTGTAGGLLPITAGNWLGQSDKFLGLRFEAGGNTYYGWARLDVDGTGSSFTIKDYAYESTPDAGISAGDQPVSVNEQNVANSVNMLLQGNDLVVNVLNTELHNGSVIVTNLAGQVVANHPINGTTGRYDVSSYAKGMYIITVRFNEGQKTQKLFIGQ